MRAHDWAATPLGTPDAWPEGLKVPLRMMLTSRFEMWLGWGADLAFFYNDSYVPTLGTKHPAALGRPMREVWKEIFSAVEDRITSVMRDEVATWDKALMLLLERNGFKEETYHTFSYSPLRGDSGRVEGLMCVVTEETERVISERRLETLRTLATALLPARDRGTVIEGALQALRTNLHDFPFSMVHLFGATEEGAGGSHCSSELAWPLDRLREEAAPLNGALVLGLNPYRSQDADVIGFAQLLTSQIAGALATVDAQRAEAAEMERLQRLFEQSPSFMAILRGPDHRFELVNSAYSQLIAHRDVIEKTMLESIPEARDQGVIERLDRVYSTGEPYVGQSASIMLQRTQNAALEPRFLDFVYQPIRDAAGLVSGIFVQGIDVTSAHEAGIALRESEAQFKMFAQAMPNQVWTSTVAGDLDWFNDQTYTYCGYAFEALRGQGWARIVHPEDLENAGRFWAQSLSTGAEYEVEFRLLRRDGEFRWHLARALPIRDDENAILRWIGTNTDIHERKLAEAESMRDRNRIWNATNDLMGMAGTDGYLKSVNPAWQRLLGYTDAELLSRPFLEIIEPADHPKVVDVVRRLTEGQAVNDLEDRLIHKDGSRSLIAWSAEPFGELFYIVGRNVTEQRAVESALRQSQKMEAVGQLTGGIAHDFNNLLTGISGSLELLQTRISQGRLNELDRYINAAQGASRRAAALTHRLLAFSRRQTLDPKPTNVNRLVTGMEDLIRRTVGPSVAFEVIGAGGLWPALADPNQLENALLNLCINARDAMPDGGRITIETANKWLDERAARERDMAPGQYLSLCVSDTGIGMTPDIIKRAFDPFFTTKPIGQGTGLGLSMIYGFARQSGGQVRIYSELGQGTTMCIYLPRYYGEADDIETLGNLTDAPRAEQGQTVLIVDDEATVRMLVTEVLEDLGYMAIEAGDGASALKVLQSDIRIDLLVTDVGLPGGMNGRQVAEAARVMRPGLKTLFITGYAENAVVGNGHLEPGMQVLTKPFVMETLATRIKDVISGT